MGTAARRRSREAPGQAPGEGKSFRGIVACLIGETVGKFQDLLKFLPLKAAFAAFLIDK